MHVDCECVQAQQPAQPSSVSDQKEFSVRVTVYCLRFRIREPRSPIFVEILRCTQITVNPFPPTIPRSHADLVYQIRIWCASS